MSTGQVSAGYAIGQKSIARTPGYGLNKIKKARKKEMKLTLKQRFRNWLMDHQDDIEADRGIYVEEDKLSSEGMRLQIYKASGGYVVETRSYDRNRDRNQNTMHVITEAEDLGDRLAKIIMMEALQR
jgi:hypothetical protein